MNGLGMLDLHCHILPAVDDGSGSMQDSIEMALLAQSSGVRGIVATPHANLPAERKNFWSAGMEQHLNELQSRLHELDIHISLYPGQEIFLSAVPVEALRNGSLIGLNHSRYLLVEFDPQEPAQTACRMLQQLCAEGYVPVVAHPERYCFVQEDADAAFKIKETGSLLQLNKSSFKGSFGRRAMYAAHRMLHQRTADFIASDAHSQYLRTPSLAGIHEMICEQYSEEYAALLLEINPARVLADQDTLHI